MDFLDLATLVATSESPSLSMRAKDAAIKLSSNGLPKVLRTPAGSESGATASGYLGACRGRAIADFTVGAAEITVTTTGAGVSALTALFSLCRSFFAALFEIVPAGSTGHIIEVSDYMSKAYAEIATYPTEHLSVLHLHCVRH